MGSAMFCGTEEARDVNIAAFCNLLPPTVRLGRELEESSPYRLSVHTLRSQLLHKFELLITPQGKLEIRVV